MCVRNMTSLFIFMNIASVILYKTFSNDFILFLKLCLVKTSKSAMKHIDQTPLEEFVDIVLGHKGCYRTP